MTYATGTAPELVHCRAFEDRRVLVTAEKRLAAGDPKGVRN